MVGKPKVDEQHSVWKTDTHIEEGKNKSVQWADQPLSLGFYQLMGSGQWPGHVDRPIDAGEWGYRRDACGGYGPTERLSSASQKMTYTP